jgi:hypothetical protein
MVVFSCISFAANNTANHFIFNKSNIRDMRLRCRISRESLLTPIRRCGLTEMVAGILFLVPDLII